MGLFSKKVCSVCGGDIGLFGNRKLEDGNLCKDCAAKLSPFFRERRSSTVREIQEQLAYRAANQLAVMQFNVTRSLGWGTKVLLDEDAKQFIVSSSSKWQQANPDVIPFASVTGCAYKISEKKTKIEKEEEQASQNQAPAPAQPQAANNMRPVAAPAPAQKSAVEQFAAQRAPQPATPQGAFAARAGIAAPAHPARPMAVSMVGSASVAPPAPPAPEAPAEPEYEYSYDFDMTINVNNPYFDEITFRVNDGHIDSKDSLEYANTLNTCEEIKAVLGGIRQDVRDAIEAAAAPKTAVTCPHCGASTLPDENGRCEYCGGSVL